MVGAHRHGAFPVTCALQPVLAVLAHPMRPADLRPPPAASLVIVGGAMLASAAVSYAAAHPDVNFLTIMPRLSIGVPGFVGSANAAFVTARLYEGYFVSGFVAATVMTAGKAGFIAMPEATEVAARANAFLLGVREAIAAGLSPLAADAPVSLLIYNTPVTLTDANEAYAAELLLAAGVEGAGGRAHRDRTVWRHGCARARWHRCAGRRASPVSGRIRSLPPNSFSQYSP